MTDNSDNKSTPYQTRPLCADDLEAVIAIDKAGTGTSRRGYFNKRLEAATERPKDYVYVGLHGDGKLVGFAFAKMVEGDFGNPGASASLDAMGVDPDYSGKGAGHQVLGAVEEILAHKGVSELTSQVNWANHTLLSFLCEQGFDLDSRIVLTRSTDKMPMGYYEAGDDDDMEIDHSSPDGDDQGALSHDKVLVRSMKADDLRSITSIDKKVFNVDRSAYYERKQHEALNASGVQVSLVAELEEYPVGFIMARVDFGEFGTTGKEAVLDTIGVDPGYQGHGVGQALMSQLMASLAILQVENVRTEVEWNNTGIISYFDTAGFVPSQVVTLRRKL